MYVSLWKFVIVGMIKRGSGLLRRASLAMTEKNYYCEKQDGEAIAPLCIIAAFQSCKVLFPSLRGGSVTTDEAIQNYE
jgi:hypothetical protein